MRIKMDTSTVRFMVTKPAEAKMDRDTQQQRVDRATGALLWQVGDFVRLDGLVAIPSSQGDRSGVAFRASSLTAIKPAQQAS